MLWQILISVALYVHLNWSTLVGLLELKSDMHACSRRSGRLTSDFDVAERESLLETDADVRRIAESVAVDTAIRFEWVYYSLHYL
jgi:hypothetical protein